MCSKAATTHSLFLHFLLQLSFQLSLLISQQSHLLQNQTKTRAYICSHPSYLLVEYTVPVTACLSISQSARHVSHSTFCFCLSFWWLILIRNPSSESPGKIPRNWEGETDQHAATRPARKFKPQTTAPNAGLRQIHRGLSWMTYSIDNNSDFIMFF